MENTEEEMEKYRGGNGKYRTQDTPVVFHRTVDGTTPVIRALPGSVAVERLAGLSEADNGAFLTKHVPLGPLILGKPSKLKV